jgi:hypothetical protein
VRHLVAVLAQSTRCETWRWSSFLPAIRVSPTNHHYSPHTPPQKLHEPIDLPSGSYFLLKYGDVCTCRHLLTEFHDRNSASIFSAEGVTAVCYETSAPTRRHIPEDSNLHSHHCKDLTLRLSSSSSSSSSHYCKFYTDLLHSSTGRRCVLCPSVSARSVSSDTTKQLILPSARLAVLSSSQPAIVARIWRHGRGSNAGKANVQTGLASYSMDDTEVRGPEREADDSRLCSAAIKNELLSTK